MIKFIFSKVADLKPKAHSLDEKNTTKKIVSNKTFFYMRIIKAMGTYFNTVCKCLCFIMYAFPTPTFNHIGLEIDVQECSI